MNERRPKFNEQRVRKMLLYLEYVTFCLKRELLLLENDHADTSRQRLLKRLHGPPAKARRRNG